AVVLATGLPVRGADLCHGRLRNDQAALRDIGSRPSGTRRARTDPVRRRRPKGRYKINIFKDLQIMFDKLLVRRAAVLGAGVMGAQIAAHLTNAGVDTVLFDLPAKEGDANGVVLKAVANLGKLSPAPLADKALAERIVAANYETGLELLKDCDLIIEAIAE